jgi:probable F420-dependent oxidoreductase
MEFGVKLPDFGKLATRDGLLRTAVLAEELGYHSVWSSDHIAWPDPATLASRYPYAEDNSSFMPAGTPWLDCIGSLTFVAAATERVRLGTTVLVLGYRPVLQQAKALATLDHLSGGRTILGVGVGWMREEFEVLGRPWDRRGRRADEVLEIFEVLWREQAAAFDGPFTQFGPVGFAPKPPGGHIPVWVGGHSEAAFRRTARFGDAFHSPRMTPGALAAERDGVRRACEAIDRDPASVQMTTALSLLFDSRSEREDVLSGSTERIIDQLGAFAEVGVEHLTLFLFARGGLDGRLDVIRRFAQEVMPAFR